MDSDTAPTERRARAGANTTDGPLVVFIAGSPRSGSTLLGNALGQIPGCIHVGELRLILEELDSYTRTCGCGQQLCDCELWRAVRLQAFGPDTPPVDWDELAHFCAREFTYRPRAWVKLRRQARLSVPFGPSADRYAEALRRFYLAIADVTGTDVIVDSSKAALHVCLGARFAGLPAHVVHLVRDPRAVAYSWRRSGIDGVTYGPTRISFKWMAGNLTIEALSNDTIDSSYTLVRYEDFVRNPMDTLEALSSQIGLRPSSLPFVDANTIRMGANHTVAGNSNRFTSGDVRLEPDDEWRRRMRVRDRVLATLPAAGLLRRYAYPVRIP